MIIVLIHLVPLTRDGFDKIHLGKSFNGSGVVGRCRDEQGAVRLWGIFSFSEGSVE